uniref:Reverse transcriptase domain-containing protein n=1 Tax=Nothobranchius furzeri TaxID=105023 RepID=A0A8C6NY71_NOTFU
MDFTQHVAQSTHDRGHTLDLVITSGLSTGVSSVVDLAISAHFCVFFNITSINQEETSVRIVIKCHLTPEVAAGFLETFKKIPPINLNAPCDFIFNDFNSRLKSTLDLLAPPKIKKLQPKPASPWSNENLKILKRSCRVMERKWRKYKNTINKQLYTELLKSYNKAVRNSRNNYFSKIISEHKNNPKILFSTITNILGCEFSSLQKTPSDALCEELAAHFRGKVDTIRSNILSSHCHAAPDQSESVCLPEETLDSFVLVEAEIIDKVFTSERPTTCVLDPIPTRFFKQFYDSFRDEILTLMNCSLQTEVFPAAFKRAVVRPLLEKSNLDFNDFNNFRPVSNLPFLSKILEKLVLIQLNDFINHQHVLEKFQSGFRVNHSTKILNDFRTNFDARRVTVLVLLDLSAAFDTVEHTILLTRLKKIGLSGAVHSWFTSYLTDRTFMVSLDTCSSGVHSITCGVPQGSILGPVLFNLYMLPLGSVIRRHGVNFHSYADDTQLYISVSPDVSQPMETLFNCILDIKSWMTENFLQLNQGKTEVLVIGPEAQREKLLPKLQSVSFYPSLQVKNLGVILDSELTFIPHIKNITKIGFYHLKNIARARPILSLANTETLMHAFIICRIDYCNALLSGLPKKSISGLQLLQNSAARVLTKTRKREHITPVLNHCTGSPYVSGSILRFF